MEKALGLAHAKEQRLLRELEEERGRHQAAVAAGKAKFAQVKQQVRRWMMISGAGTRPR